MHFVRVILQPEIACAAIDELPRASRSAYIAMLVTNSLLLLVITPSHTRRKTQRTTSGSWSVQPYADTTTQIETVWREA